MTSIDYKLNTDCTVPALPTIANGNFTAVATTYPSTAELICNEGYVQSGGPCFVTCLANGNWSATTATCIKISKTLMCFLLTKINLSELTFRLFT